jgi:cytochrome c-type biogenesis protein CcmH/NrfF
VRAGKSDDEIKAGLIGQYSARILAMPEGASGQWLSWAPVAAVCGGLGAVALAVQRMRQPAPLPAEHQDLPPLPDLD